MNLDILVNKVYASEFEGYIDGEIPTVLLELLGVPKDYKYCLKVSGDLVLSSTKVGKIARFTTLVAHSPDGKQFVHLDEWLTDQAALNVDKQLEDRLDDIVAQNETEVADIEFEW